MLARLLAGAVWVFKVVKLDVAIVEGRASLVIDVFYESRLLQGVRVRPRAALVPQVNKAVLQAPAVRTILLA